MEIIVGLLFWGGLLVLVSGWVVRSYRGPSSGMSGPPTAPVVPPTRPSTSLPVVEESAREGGALVDGLIIGHHLTRTHYEEKLAEQAETVEALRADVTDHVYPGGDDLEDGDDLDGYGYGADALDDVEPDEFGSDGSDESGGGSDAWDDDVFGYDEEDDDY